LTRAGLIVWSEPVEGMNTSSGFNDEGHANTPLEGISSPERLCVASRNPFDGAIEEEISRRWSGVTSFWIIGARLLDSLLSELSSLEPAMDTASDSADLARLRELAEEAPVIAFVNGLFSEALELNASDVHIEPGADGFNTRLRVDGVLGHERQHPKSTFDSVVTRLKILSGMDIAERRLPQDGRQTIRVAGEEVDLRVSSLPATEGESVVIRLLRKKSELPDMKGLGLRGKTLLDFKRSIELPNGVFLVTGPTGSGKSTTLYRAIRDRETAEVAIQAALTGHLVLSTLHTNSARGAIERLIDLGVEPFLIGAALRGVLGQRLLRRLCQFCRRVQTDRGLLNMVESLVPIEALGGETLGDTFFEASGCEKCSNSGYKGRIGVYELLDIHGMQAAGMTGQVTELAKINALNAFGFRSMLQDSLLKTSRGETSLSELERVFGRLDEG